MSHDREAKDPFRDWPKTVDSKKLEEQVDRERQERAAARAMRNARKR